MVQVVVEGVRGQPHIVLSLQNVKYFLGIVHQQRSTSLIKCQRNLTAGIHPCRVTHVKADEPTARRVVIRRMHIVSRQAQLAIVVVGHLLERLHAVEVSLVGNLATVPHLITTIELDVIQFRRLFLKCRIFLSFSLVSTIQTLEMRLICLIRHPEVLGINPDAHLWQRLSVRCRQCHFFLSLFQPPKLTVNQLWCRPSVNLLVRDALLQHLNHLLHIPRSSPLPWYYPIQILSSNPSRPLPLGQMLIHVAVVRFHIGCKHRHLLPQELHQRLQQPFHILNVHMLVVIIVNLTPPMVILHHVQIGVSPVPRHCYVIPLRLPRIVRLPLLQIVRPFIDIIFRPTFCIIERAPVQRLPPRHLNPQRVPIVVPRRCKHIQQPLDFQQQLQRPSRHANPIQILISTLCPLHQRHSQFSLCHTIFV